MSLTETCPTCILLYVEAVSQGCRWGCIVAQNQMDQWEQLICNFLSLFRNLKQCLRVRFISQQKLNTELLSSFCPVHGASDRLLTLSRELKAVRVCVCFVDLTAFLGGVGGLHPPGLSDSVFSRSHFIFCRWSDSVGVIKQHRPAYSGVSATLGIKHNISKSASLSERVEYPREFVNEVFMSDGGSVELTDELVQGQECCRYRISLS